MVPLDIPGYAVGTTEILIEGEQKRCWAQVLGTKIVKEPTCLGGINLLLGLWKFLQLLEYRSTSPDSTVKKNGAVTIRTNYLADLSEYTLMRWK